MKPDTSPNQYPDRAPESDQTPAAPAEAPLNPSTPESAPNLPPVAPEAPVFSPEQTEAQPERRVQEPTTQPTTDNNDAATAALPPVQPMQSPPAAVTDDDADSPAIADDVDVIEKVWVDKAKQVIAETKDDPYQQEQQVEKLQQNYLKKRYGKTINSSPEL